MIESGKLSLSPEPVSLAEVMSECQAMMEPQAQKRGISMTFPQFDIPYFVNADRTRVKQVLINLLSNAIKYNRRAGNGRGDVHRDQPGAHPHQRQGHRRGIASGKAGAALPAVQSSRTGGQRRGRHRHRPGGEQAAGRADGGRDRRGEHGRGGKRVLVRAALDLGAAHSTAAAPSLDRRPAASAGRRHRCAPCSMSRTTRRT